jgi:hypothetical protein
VWHSKEGISTIDKPLKDITNWHNADVFAWHMPLDEIWPVIDFGDWYIDLDIWQYEDFGIWQ